MPCLRSTLKAVSNRLAFNGILLVCLTTPPATKIVGVDKKFLITFTVCFIVLWRLVISYLFNIPSSQFLGLLNNRKPPVKLVKL